MIQWLNLFERLDNESYIRLKINQEIRFNLKFEIQQIYRILENIKQKN